MDNYQVDVDITMSATLHFAAESEQEAEALASEAVKNAPYYYAGRGHYVDHSIFSVDKE